MQRLEQLTNKKAPDFSEACQEWIINPQSEFIYTQGYSVKSVALKLGRTPASIVAKLNNSDNFYIGMTDPEFWNIGKTFAK